jgi:hypothetical protein
MAQTPVESLADSYEDYKGVKVIDVSGTSMAFARPYIKKSPMGPLADNVAAVTIMSLKKAAENIIYRFEPEQDLSNRVEAQIH